MAHFAGTVAHFYRNIHSEDEIVTGIKDKLNTARKISTSSDTSKYPNNLVYIKD